jgi:putative oxidoreductase
MMMTDAQRAMMRTHGTLVGRVLLGLLFFVSGVMMLMDGAPVGMIEGMGIPLAGLVAWVVVLVKVLGGAGLILGYRVGCSAGALFVFTLLTVLLVHNNAEEMTAALKNLSIMGGLLYVMAFGPGEGWRIAK